MADSLIGPVQVVVAVSNATLATAVSGYNTAIAAAVVAAQTAAVGPAGSGARFGITIGPVNSIYNGTVYSLVGYVTYSTPGSSS